MCLKFRAESLNQQQLMDQLPKSICNSICEQLFMPIVKDVYLFKGVSREMLLLLVRFFPPTFMHAIRCISINIGMMWVHTPQIP